MQEKCLIKILPFPVAESAFSLYGGDAACFYFVSPWMDIGSEQVSTCEDGE